MNYPGHTPVKENGVTASNLLQIGIDLDTSGEWDRALICFEHAIKVQDHSPDDALRAELLRRMGHVWSKKGEWEKAQERYQESLRICEENGDNEGKAAALCSIGTIHFEKGSWEKVRKFYGAALRVNRKTGNIKLVGQIYSNLGAMNNILGNWDAAIRYYKRCIPIFEETYNEGGLAETYHNLGITFVDKGDLTDADQYFAKSLEISERTGDIRLCAYSSLNRAEIGRLQKKLNSAMKLGNKAFSALKEVDDKLGMAEAYRILGSIEREQGNCTKSEEDLLLSVDIYRRYDNPLGIAESYHELGLTLEGQGRSQEALEAFSESFRVFREIKARKSMEEIDQKIIELEAHYFQTARSMGESAESKDTYTIGHSQRVANYALAIAKKLDLRIEERKAILLASFLHDYGKINVGSHILGKPGKLTEEEFEVIKKHPLWGIERLSDVNFPWEVKPLILHHQEKWDGTGYPIGLAGEKIPLGARIIAVADFFDALTTDRPYRDALPLEVVFGIIEEETGRILDPEIAPVFVDLVRARAGDSPSPSSDSLEFLQLWNSKASLKP